MQRKLTITLVTLVVLVFGSLIATLVAGNEPALGLDLQGGISVTQQPVGDYEPETLDLAVERIRDRVDSLGVAEPEILRQGDAIVVNLPGVKNQQEAIDLVQVTGQVYLRPVQGCIADQGDASSDSTVPSSTDATGSTTATTASSATTAVTETTAAPGPSRQVHRSSSPDTTVAGTDTTTADTTPSDTGDIPAASTSVPADGTTATTTAPATTSGTDVVSDPTTQQWLPLRSGGQCRVGPAGGTGEVFNNDASAQIISGSGWGVTVGLRDGAAGEDTWNAIARSCFNGDQSCPSRQLAIELDGEIISAPTVNVPEFNNNVEITGQFSEGEARNLANVLKSGSLGVTMQTQSVQNVSPTLGKDSLNAAIVSGLIGVALVLLLLILYYRTLGLVVAAGLCIAAAILYSVISLLSRTQGLALSLAGVAGIIVSVGVTVDSYVVFFERLKDEVRSGRTLRNSAQRGFTGAWRTILMADIVSLIGAFTLWWLTVGSVRNFAFFLGLSTLVDLLVSYFFTRPAVLLLARTDFMARRGVMGIKPVAAGAGSAS